MLEKSTDAIRQLLSREGPSDTTLKKIEAEMRQLATDVDFSQYRRAVPGEELTHKLDLALDGGASLYLVSDGVGVATPPHRHETWAIIVGLEGREMNQIYKISSSEKKQVKQIDVKTIGRGDAVIMGEEDIHGTVSVGDEATFHLHLYGVNLSTLSPISERTYEAVPLNYRD